MSTRKYTVTCHELLVEFSHQYSMPIYDHNKDLISVPIKCGMQHWRRQKERVGEDKLDGLNYKHDGGILGIPDGPG